MPKTPVVGVEVIQACCELCSRSHEQLALRHEAAMAISRCITLGEAAAWEALQNCDAIWHISILVVDAVGAIGDGVESLQASQTALGLLAHQMEGCGSLAPLMNPSCVDAVVTASRSGCEELARSAGWLLCTLCTEPETSCATLEQPTSLTALFEYAQSGSTRAQEEAAWAIAALSAEPGAADHLVERTECFPQLLELLQVQPCLPSNSVSAKCRLQCTEKRFSALPKLSRTLYTPLASSMV